MRAPKLPLMPVSALFEETPDLSYLRDMPRKEPKAPAPPMADFRTNAAAPKARKKAIATGVPGGAPAVEPMASPIQPVRQPFMAHDTGQPTLAQQTRPDLPHGHIRQQQHMERYNDQQASAENVRHLGDSRNAVFHSRMSNGHQAILKPLATIDPTHQPERIGAKNAHLYDFLSAVGAHHMGTPNFVGTFHGHGQLTKRHPYPDESDTPEKQLKMARSHAGQPAHVVEFSPGENLSHSSQGDIDAVDDQHRMIGAVAHVLHSQTDGHGGNIRLSRGQNGKVHPVLFDNDIGGESHAQRAWREMHGKESVRSHFLPGGKLAYDKNGMQWGTNFPPEVQAQLHSYVRGEHFGQHGIHPDDASLIQRNAHELLTHGLEGTLANRAINQPDRFRQNDATQTDHGNQSR
jgi:hypothetical protein